MFYLDHVKLKDPLRYELDLGGNWMDESQENIMLRGSSDNCMSQRIEFCEVCFPILLFFMYSFTYLFILPITPFQEHGNI